MSLQPISGTSKEGSEQIDGLGSAMINVYFIIVVVIVVFLITTTYIITCCIIID